MKDRILLVDDEINVLESLSRHLRRDYEVHTALSGRLGLEEIERTGPFAVVVSDMQMPEMNGVTFLKAVRNLAPETTRMMLTGQADLETAMNAVNEGHIFLFMTKPFPPEMMLKAIRDGVNQYHLRRVEREVLEDTLSGSVKVLMEVLSLVNPAAFGRTQRIRYYTSHIVNELNLPDKWQYELASTLALIGCVTVPQETLDKVYAGIKLQGDELDTYLSHTRVAKDILCKIPRMNIVSAIIEQSGMPLKVIEGQNHNSIEEQVMWGSHILKASIEFDLLLTQGLTSMNALSELGRRHIKLSTKVLASLANLQKVFDGETEKSMYIKDLSIGMSFNEDVYSKSGMLIAVKGQEISFTVLQRLRTFAKSTGIVEPILVLVKG